MEETDDILKNFPKGDPFKVPEGFFEQFKEDITGSVQKRIVLQSFFARSKQPLKLAASFALFIVFTYLIVLFIQFKQNPVVSDNSLSQDTLSYEYAFVDEFYTADALSDTTTEEEISKDEYVEFLLDRNVSYDQLADYY